MNTCSGCTASWTGHRTAHCGNCHRTFSTVSNFDKHRSPDGEHGHCRYPGVVGLVQRDGVWSMPSDPNKPNWWTAAADVGPTETPSRNDQEATER